MTPQERQRVAELFDRLESLEDNPRDPAASKMIADGLARAPNAPYALVQTVLVQDEALRAADARIRELEGGSEPANQGGFLDSMRDALLGRREGARGSVPSVPAAGGAPWQQTNPAGYQQPGGSFLGTAAAGAAGVIGGALLLNSFRSMFGGHQQSMMDSGRPGNSPWDGNASGSDLARDAGVDDIGRNGRTASDDSRAGLFDTAQNDSGDSDDFDSDFDFGGDGDSDSA